MVKTIKIKGENPVTQLNKKKPRKENSTTTKEHDEPTTSEGYVDKGDKIDPTTCKSIYSEYLNLKSVVVNHNITKVEICKICTEKNIDTTEISMKGSNTSGLKWHQKKKHPDIFNEMNPQKKNIDLS